MITKLLSISTAFALTINALAQIPTNGLVAYYPFTGNANDASGNNLDGTVTGASLTTDRFGNANSAYIFNGSSDNISVASNSLLDFQTTNAFSLSYWIRPTSLSTSQISVILSKQTGSGASQDGWNSNIETNFQSKYRIQNGTSTSSCTFAAISPTISSNQYQHIVQIYNGSNSYIYINGLLANQTACTALIGDNLSNMLIGKATWVNSNTKGFSGIIDDIAIYNRALTPSEVTQIYTGCNFHTSAIANGSTTFCQGNNVTLSSNQQGSPFTFKWLINNSIINGATSANYTVAASGNYSVIVDSLGCIDTSDVITVTVNQLPNVSINTIPTFVNYYATPFLLSGNPNGGSFFVNGIA
ncbi:MAG: LamG domain-containing protein, partial [Bacteroidia bacterium]